MLKKKNFLASTFMVLHIFLKKIQEKIIK